MKFTNLLFLGAALAETTQAFKLSNTDIDKDAAKSASHAAAKYAKDHGQDPKHAVSQANATIKHYDGAKAQAHVIAATPDRPVLHESDSKHDTKLTNGAGSPKDVVKMAATKAKKEGKDPAEAAKNAIAKITKAAAKAGIKPGPKNIVSASAHMAKDAGHDPKKAAVKATKKIQHAAANSVKADPAKAKVKASSAPKLTAAKKTAAINSATNGSLHESNSKHDTKLTNGAGSPKDVVKMAATKAKKEGKDPAEAAKKAIAKITKAAAKAGIKPGPKNVVNATAHMAKDAGHDPKKAAVKATKKIQHAAAKKVVAADPTKAKAKASSAPKTTAASKASLHESDSKHNTVTGNGVGTPKDVVKMAATKAKKEGKDPAEAAKKAIAKISKAAAKAGIKPGPKNVAKAAAHMAHHAGHDPKKAAAKATKTIMDKAKQVAATPTTADSSTPAAHAATATTK